MSLRQRSSGDAGRKAYDKARRAYNTARSVHEDGKKHTGHTLRKLAVVRKRMRKAVRRAKWKAGV